MGWNSWNAFRTDVDEEKVVGAARVLVDSGLAGLGYVYVNLDDGWWLKRRAGDGRLQIRTGIFPSAATGGPDGTSFRPFTDKLHAMGLKAGIYTDIGRNACSQAYDLHSPNLPQGTTAEREVGLDGHVAQDIGLYFKDWGFDYIKVDACGLADFAPGSDLVQRQRYRGLTPLIERGPSTAPTSPPCAAATKPSPPRCGPPGRPTTTCCRSARGAWRTCAPGARKSATCGARAATSRPAGPACCTTSTAPRNARCMPARVIGTIPTSCTSATRNSTPPTRSKCGRTFRCGR
ncbi:alpha-galactosidase/alpha-n-acetylgalactosaminidase, putative [Ricinus communis]|uniref:Alpha-galactosidase/alpha-n-acetylgalactosaminidase, putative n=1 Tax=Ricinus communis TaxID=3988 RepID=B9TAQ6_RICCO|nr:alpha-galactosidase/alpha-n-acetylgalactosaminidase, putative [Ricinus communis]